MSLASAGVFDRTEGIRQDIDMGTVRLNYMFGGTVASRYGSACTDPCGKALALPELFVGGTKQSE